MSQLEAQHHTTPFPPGSIRLWSHSTEPSSVLCLWLSVGRGALGRRVPLSRSRALAPGPPTLFRSAVLSGRGAARAAA